MTSPVVIWRNQKLLSKSVGQVGEIVSWTIIRVAQLNFVDQAPYPVVLVKLSNGSTTVGQLVDYDRSQLHVGQKVVTVIRKTFQPSTTDVIPYGIKFKPL